MAEKITTAQFKEKVFNYDNATEWKYQGELPAIVDFYADWCGPCKMLAPTLDQISKDFAGKLVVYKVNTDEEPELADYFRIQSIPTLLFIPLKGEPQVAHSALPKATIEKILLDAFGISR